MQSWFDSLAEPKKLIWIEANDHFFGGELDAFERALIEVQET